MKEDNTVKVIFTQDVRGQGKKGEMKEVSDGYGRNYLLPRKLAMEATKDNLNTLRLQEKARAAQMAAEKAKAQENAARLESLIVKISARAGAGGKLFGSITSKEISETLQKQHGVEIDPKKIVQAEPIKGYGSFEVKCKFGYEISGTIHVLVVEEK